MRRGGPEVVNGQYIPVENPSGMPSETDPRDLASPLRPTDEAEPDMSFLEALTAESLGPDPIEEYDISISSTGLDMVHDWSADTWSAGNQLVEDSTDILDSSLLGSFCDPILYQTPQDPFDQYLFTHYMDTLSLRLYPVKLDSNPYRNVYGSLATESEPVLKAIMLASAFHLSKLGKLPAFAVKPYRMAMQRSFRDALKTQNDEWALGATVFLSIVFDVIGTGMDTWSSKLIGCRQLLERTLSNRNLKMDSGLRCMLLQYNWAVTMGKTLLRGVLPAATFNELKCIDESEKFRTASQRMGSSANETPSFCLASALHGVAEDIEMAHHQSQWWDNLPDYQMHIFLRQATEYSLTVERLKFTPNGTDELLQLMPHVAQLVNKIQAWQPNVVAVQPEYMESIHHFNEIWRLGMICFVHGEIYCLEASDDLVQTYVEASLEPLRKLTWLQACLFPMFMIAVHAQTEEARTVFNSKLKEMHNVLGFQAPLSVASVLKSIWERSDATVAGKFKWKEVIKDLRMELNIIL
ncbi:hypothetical protein PCG10_009590 [Penicillium crustosum]|uniref:Uncharacterized protein n=1 Tax=Penicillium crustosum TaxID=36656 RepID=A0A9P5GTP3_PENCR|nr:Protein of unknown function DUF3468 [Penicillium crustosum]KAF7528876.1 hypothetical protein PCG10_009590 [Penicillium crustosum]KAJ5416863.1 Protein of unknown function DUF3468 [Penicillium crustosum]